jgi:membrane protease YdiL (CAAX protease family)
MTADRKTATPRIRRPTEVPGLPQPPPRSYPEAAGSLLLAFASLALLASLLRRSWPALDFLLSQNTLQAMVIGGIITQGGLILLPTLLTILVNRLPAADLTGGRPRAGSLILSVSVGVPAAVVFQGLNNLLLYMLLRSGIDLPAPTQATGVGGSLFQHSWAVMILIVLVSVIVPGVAEELMFRGVILASLRSSGAFLSAIVWQAAAFALFHGDPLFLLPPFLTGLLLAAVRRSSDSIYPAMLTHMTLNLTLLAINPLLPRLTAQYLLDGKAQAQSLLYASLIAACVAAVALVPLLILIIHLQQPPSRQRLHIWPADWKFALAFLVLLATMILENT